MAVNVLTTVVSRLHNLSESELIFSSYMEKLPWR